MQSKFVNIIIPVYNGKQFIRSTIDSILKQSYKNIRIIIVNDGSTDETVCVINKFLKTNKNIYLINQKNKGPGAARNKGLDFSYKFKSSFTLILDSDDSYDLTMIEKMVNNSLEKNADITICECLEKNVKTNKINSISTNIKYNLILSNTELFKPSEIKNHIFEFSVGWAWDKLYKTSFLKKTKLKFQEIKNTDDAYFVFCSIFKAKRISILKETLIIHNVNNSSSVSSNRHENYLCSWVAIEGIRNNLIRSKMYKKYEIGFLRWALIFSVWFLGSMPNLKYNSFLFDTYVTHAKKNIIINKKNINYLKNSGAYYMYKCIMTGEYKKFIKISNGGNKLKKIIKKIDSKNIPIIKNIISLLYRIHYSFR